MRVISIVLLLAALASAAPREDNATSALINEALDKSVSLRLDGVLPDVLKTIETKTGVQAQPTDPVYDLLPWGAQTRITATIENQTLRKALTAITQKLGLTWELGDYEVWLKPMPPLARLGRRATVAELHALDLLSSTPLELKAEKPTLQELIDAIDHKLRTIKDPQLGVDLRPGDPSNPQAGFIKLDQTINVPRNATIAEALEGMAAQSDATWYPWGKNIAIVPKQEQIRMQLDKTISARWDGVDIAQVLDRLSKRSGVPFTTEAGALQRVPPEYRSVRLELQNVTVRQVLDNIRALTGLDYLVKPDGLYVWNQNSNPTAAPHGGPTDPVVAMLTLDGGMQLFLRESEVPADVRAYLNHKTDEEIQRLRRRMKDEGFAPATQPTSSAEEKNQ